MNIGFNMLLIHQKKLSLLVDMFSTVIRVNLRHKQTEYQNSIVNEVEEEKKTDCIDFDE